MSTGAAPRPSRRDFLRTAAGAALAAGAAGCGGETADGGSVLVVGGGLAGLAVLDGLARAGRPVELLEASERLGGRIHTLRAGLDAGLRAEAGAEQVPRDHRRVRRLCRTLGVGLADYPPPAGLFTLRSGGRAFRFREPAELPEELTGGLTEKERTAWPHRLHLVHAAASEPLPPDDPRSGLQWLRDRGLSGQGERFVRAFSTLDPERTAAPAYREAALREIARSGAASIAGGTDTLTNALAGRHRERIRTGVRIRRVALREGGVVLEDAEGAPRRASRVVLALPYRPLLALEWEPAPPSSVRRLVGALEVAEELKVHARIALADLERRGLSQFFMGFDFPRLTWTLPERSPDGMAVLNAMAVREDLPGVRSLLAKGTASLGLLLRERLPELSSLRVTTAGRDFNTDPLFGGTYTFRGAGSPPLRPPAPEGPVLLAGSDLSSLRGWMEGALESAERVVKEVLQS